MEKKNVFSKILAITGTVFVWFPVIAPILASAVISSRAGKLHFDYLLPAEFFPVFLVGAGLLIWAAIRAHSRIRYFAWSLGITIGMLFLGQGLAIITGLASGANEAAGWRLYVVIAFLVLFTLGIIATGVGGILLIRDLCKPKLDPSLSE